MFISKKRFDEMLASGNDQIAQRDQTISRLQTVIGSLQRENSGLRSDVAAAEAAYDASYIELSRWRDLEAKRQAPLRAFNAARKARAQQKELG